jgi:hypothetical protein
MKEVKKICGNCLLYDPEKKHCKVAVLIEGKTFHMPVFVEDKCHMEELDIPIQQVRWWVEDENGQHIAGKGTVKMEYPENFFGPEKE